LLVVFGDDLSAGSVTRSRRVDNNSEYDKALGSEDEEEQLEEWTSPVKTAKEFGTPKKVTVKTAKEFGTPKKITVIDDEDDVDIDSEDEPHQAGKGKKVSTVAEKDWISKIVNSSGKPSSGNKGIKRGADEVTPTKSAKKVQKEVTNENEEDDFPEMAEFTVKPRATPVSAVHAGKRAMASKKALQKKLK
jgi:hypothetical protein